MPRPAIALCLLFAATLVRADPPAPRPAVDEAQVVHLADAHWNPIKLPEVPAGGFSSLVAGDPKTGPSLAYAKFSPGFAFPAHHHSHTEYTVLLSGAATFVVDNKPHALVAGSYLVIPAGVPHSVTCEAPAECLLLTRRAGATDYQFEKK